MKFHAVALSKLANRDHDASASSLTKVGAGKGDTIRDVKRLLAAAAPEKWWLTLGMLALILSAGVNLVMPYMLGLIVKQNQSGDILKVISQAALIFAAGSFCAFVRGFMFAYAGERMVARLRRELFDSVIEQEMSFFDTVRTGEVVNRLSADTALIQVAGTLTLSLLLRFFLQFAGGSIILMVISWKLTLVMLAPLPLLGTFAFLYGRYVKRLSNQVQTALAACAVVAEESLSSIQYVRTFGNEARESARYGQRVMEAFGLGKLMSFASGTVQGAAELASYISVLLVIGYGSSLVADGELADSLLFSYVIYTVYVAHALGAFSHQSGDFMRAVGASQRVFFLIDRVPLINIDGGRTLPKVQGHIVIQNVSFCYPSRPELQVLKNVTLDLPAGQVVALVGPSGSGKSTVAQLLLRLYDVNEGSITLDGVPLYELDPRWLRSQIGFVSQEPVLFGTSIRENILYGRADATDLELYEAAKAAYIDDFIRSLPQGYDTQVGERGMRLSGGQKQRISLARALLKNPPLLVLDEATSALDAESEHLVQRALVTLMRNRTVLVIAHRLSTIRNAHKVAVLQDGCIVETGTHDELYANPRGLYHKLVQRQQQQLGDGEAVLSADDDLDRPIAASDALHFDMVATTAYSIANLPTQSQVSEPRTQLGTGVTGAVYIPTGSASLTSPLSGSEHADARARVLSADPDEL